MGADADFLSMAGSIFRTCYITFTCLICDLYLIERIFLRRRKRTALILYYVMKTLALNIIMGMVLDPFFQGNIWWDTIYTIVVYVSIPINYLVLYYTYKERIIKLIVVSCIAEVTASSLGMLFLIILNLIEGRREPLIYLTTFHPLDVLLAPLTGGTLWILGHYLSPYIARVRNNRLKHEKIWWSVVITYILVASFTMFGDKSKLVLMLTVLILCGGVFTAIAAAVVRRYLKSIRTERQYLSAQQQLMESHYIAIYGQIYRMEKQQRDVDRKMQEILQIPDGGDGAEKASVYLQELKQQYQGLKAGRYCDDWMTDALLSGQAEIIRKLGIAFECSMQGYQGGRIERQDMTEILLYLLNFGVQANEKPEYTGQKWMRLRVSEVKNQTVIEFTGSYPVRNAIRKRMFRQYTKKYNGNLLIKKEAESVSVVLILEQMERGR